MTKMEISSKLYELKTTNSFDELNLFLDELEKNEPEMQSFFLIVKEDPRLLFFLLKHISKKGELIKNIRKFFEATVWYKKILKNLKHSDPIVRKYFVSEIGKCKTDVFLQLMVDKLSDNSWEVRAEIMKNLSKINTQKSLDILVYMLDDIEPAIIKELTKLLSEKETAILPYFDKYVSGPGIRIKKNILEILKRMDDYSIIPHIIILTEDSNEEVRFAAQTILFTKIEKMNIKDDVRIDTNITEFLEKQLETADSKKMVLLIKLLIRLKDVGAQIIIKKLESSGESRTEIFNLIRDIRTHEKVYVILAFILSDTMQLKSRGFDLLTKFEFEEKNSAFVIPIMENFILTHSEEFVEEERKLISAFLIKNRILEKYLKRLKDDLPEIRVISLKIIGMINEPRIIEIIKSMIKDPSKQVRVTVLKILGKYSLDSMFDIFKEMLDDPVEEVQYAAVESLAKLQDQRAKGIIFTLLENPNTKIKQLASEIIAKESLKKYIDSFDQLNPKAQERVAKLIEILDTETESILIKEIKNIDPSARKRVLEVIKHLKSKVKFKNVLQEAIKDPEKNIRSMVISLLVQIGDKDLLIELLKLLNDPDKRVRANAIEALGSLNDVDIASVTKLLAPFLKDNNNRIRANAVMALYTLGVKDVLKEIDIMLENESEFMRASGVFCIGKLTLKNKAEYIYTMKNDPSPLVRKNIVKALSRLKRKDYLQGFTMDQNPEIAALAQQYYEKEAGIDDDISRTS